MSLRSLLARIGSPLRSWFCATFRRRALEERMEAELGCHLENLTRDLIRSGLSPHEAARRAHIALGPLLKHKEQMRASFGLGGWDQLWADLRYGMRTLERSPGFAWVAVTSLALAIGANTTVFSLTKQLLLTRLDVPHPETLRLLAWTETGGKVAVHRVHGDWHSLPAGL